MILGGIVILFIISLLPLPNLHFGPQIGVITINDPIMTSEEIVNDLKSKKAVEEKPVEQVAEENTETPVLEEITTEETVEQVGKRVFELILKTASGSMSKSELNGYGDEEFNPWQVGVVM